MDEVPKCPKCGADYSETSFRWDDEGICKVYFDVFRCGTQDAGTTLGANRSDACRIAELQQQLAAATQESSGFKAESEAIRRLAREQDLKIDQLDSYERWLTDIGKAIGCGHIDDRLPRCVEEVVEDFRSIIKCM